MAKKVNIKELARRYTTAVFELAKSEHKLDVLSADLEKAENLIKSNDSLKKLLGSPLLSEAEQIKVMKEIGYSQKLNILTINFLLIIVRNGRLQYLEQIIHAFREQIAEENGQLTAEITTAEKLGEKQLAAIIKELSAKTGKKVQAKEIVRPEIIGGMIVKIGAKMFDYSVKSRLTKLKNKLQEAS